MNEEYLINDMRVPDEFKLHSFSNYPKKDIFQVLIKSIDKRQIENACYWATECILSGYLMELWEKCMIYSMKVIHINNPRLPGFLKHKQITFFSIIQQYESKKISLFHMRNDQVVRNLLFSLVTALSLSSKAKRYDKVVKLKEEHFRINHIQTMLCSNVHILPEHFIHFNEPNELKLIMNEIYFHLKNKLSGYEKSIYWIEWIMKWEQLNKKKKVSWCIDERNVPVEKKYKSDLVWILWSIILEETKTREPVCQKEIHSIYSLYLENFRPGKRKKRMPYIYMAVGLLTHSIDYSLPIIQDIPVYLQSQSNCNSLFKTAKINEKNNIPIQKPKKKKTPNQIKKEKEKTDKQIEKDKCLDKLQFFNDVGDMLM
jgi:hypothetical protein